MKANLISLALILVFVTVIVLNAPEMEWTGTRILGATIAVVSLALLVVARLQLGRAFAVRAKAQMLVTTGLYSRIRSPIYVFGETFLLGAAIVTGRWELFALAVGLLPVQIYRAHNEAKVLSQAFGEEYARYKAQTWF
jgi:protein-S-isoprenylcysteine O-methyltransferase Ste14